MPKAMNGEERYQYMTGTSIKRLMADLATPAIVSMLITSIYNMADTFFVGRIGTSATAAVGVVYTLATVAQALAFFFGHGSGNSISRSLGARNTDGAEKMASVGFFSAVIFGLVFCGIGEALLGPLVDLLGATETCRAESMDYARFILIGVPFQMGSLVLNNQLRLQGSAFYGMIGMAGGAVLNIAIDPLFIFVFRMGVMGAAAATALSQAVSFCLLWWILKKSGATRIRLRAFRPGMHEYAEIFRGGLPSLARQGIASVGIVFLNRAAGIYGDAAVAAMSVVSRYIHFASSATIGIGQGFQPICGFNYGAKKYGRVREAFWFCVKLSFGVLLAFSVVSFIFAPGIITLFRDDPAVIEIGAIALRYQLILFPLFSFVTLTNMMLQTMGKVIPATLVALARQGLFFLPAVLLLPRAFGLTGLELAQPVADALTVVLSVAVGAGTLRRLSRESEH